MELNIIHDIRNSPYLFLIDAGIHNDRFVLRYTSTTLSIKDVEVLNGIKVFEENDKIVVKSENEVIQSIEVHDILGRNLFNETSINLNQFTISAISPKTTTLFLIIKLDDRQQKIAKLFSNIIQNVIKRP